jgi:predicted GH43/DUF377 family glycosyl hydrolase
MDALRGRIVIYCGAAGTVIALASCQTDEVIGFVKSNSEV